VTGNRRLRRTTPAAASEGERAEEDMNRTAALLLACLILTT
jgi:hypothetical protein